MKDEETKNKFIEYLREHPQERFFQAVRNFSRFPFIYWSITESVDSKLMDTFYIESDEELSKNAEKKI